MPRRAYRTLAAVGARRAPALLLVLGALGIGACGDDPQLRAAPASTATPATADGTPAGEPEPVTTSEPSSDAAAGIRLRAIESQFGRIVGDGPGLAVYIFDKERRGRSECYGACAKAWPPVPTAGRPLAGAGIDADLLGTTRRRNGKRQLTYRDQPLYYYEHDRPGLVLCHDVVEFGGTWLVIRPNGRAVP